MAFAHPDYGVNALVVCEGVHAAQRQLPVPVQTAGLSDGAGLRWLTREPGLAL